MALPKQHFKVVGLFEGKNPRKALALARKHPETKVVGVDISEMLPYATPENLELKSHTGAAEYLRRQDANSIDHIYAHFPGVNYDERQKLFDLAMRKLKPGGKYVVLSPARRYTHLALEMRSHGFRVHRKFLTTETVEKLGTDYADEYTRDVKESNRYSKYLEGLSSSEFTDETWLHPDRPMDHEDYLCKEQQAMVKKVKDMWEKSEGPNPSEGAKRALKLMLKDLHRDFSDKPFLLTSAKKSPTINQ